MSYGFIACALAKLTNGVVYSDDSAWDYDKLPCDYLFMKQNWFRDNEWHKSCMAGILNQFG